MGKQQLTTDQKRDILRRVKKENEKVGDVAKEYNKSVGAIYKIINGKTHVSTNRERSDTVFTEEVRSLIDKMVMADRHVTAERIKANTGIDVALSTIHRYLKRKGYVCMNTKRPLRYVGVKSDK